MVIEREDDGKKGRYVLKEGEVEMGEMTFTWAGDNKFIIDHTFIDEPFLGKGYGGLLLKEAVQFARANQLKIIPLCPFAKAEFQKNKEIGDVLF